MDNLGWRSNPTALMAFFLGMLLSLAPRSVAQTPPLQPLSMPEPPAAVGLSQPVAVEPQQARVVDANGQQLPVQLPAAADGNATQPAPGAVASQSPAVPAASETATLKQNANLRLEQARANVDLLPEMKDTLTKLYQQTFADASQAEQVSTQRAAWNARIANANQALEAARAEKDNGKEAAANDDLLFLSFEEGQARLRALEADLATAAAERAKLTETITNRDKRRKELPPLISDAKAKQEQLAKVPATENGTDDPLLQEARGWSTTAARIVLDEQVTALESEQRTIEAESQLLPLQLELAQTQEKQLQERVRKVNEELSRIRQNRILNQRGEFYDLIRRLPREMQSRGEKTLERIDTWLKLSGKQAELKQELESSRIVLARWKEQRAKMEVRVNPTVGTTEASGFNSWVGLMLRKQRGELPDPNQLSSRIRYYQEEMQAADSLVFDLEDALLDIGNQQDALTTAVENDFDEFAGGATAARGQVVEQTHELLAKSEEILESMKQDVDGYLNDLYQIADVKEQTRDLAASYRVLIDEHVLWIRSSDPLRQTDLKSTFEAFRWLVSYDNWQGLWSHLFNDLRGSPWWYVLFVGAMAVLLINQSGLRRMIGQLGAKAEKKNCTEFRLTARAMLLTILISIPVPMVLLFVAWREHAAGDNVQLDDSVIEFATALGRGLLIGAAVFFPMELLRQICRLDGLAIQHFEWDKQVARGLAKNLRWLIDLSVPLSVVIGMLAAQAVPRWESSLGRLAFIALMPLLSVFFARVFLPSTGVLSQALKQNPGGWLDRLRYVWYPALVIAPLALAVVSFIGYHYTAQRFAAHFNSTVWSAIILLLIYFLAKRWLVLNRRKLMLAKARQRLEDAAKRESTGIGSGSPIAVETQEVDLTAINEQTKRLLTSGVVAAGLLLAYFIWSDILPAVTFLENFKLWPVDETTNITLANLVLVVPIVALIFIGARNVPGLMEIVFLQHLPLTGAARYAITTLTRYVIIGVGITVAASTLGLRWNSIQWLVAALGVGLGFGLQEIFANFVSGVILLFEQPIRVGDVITIDGTTGTVLKIRMRATTILNWERQELVIPNKDLITGKLLNWTLSDATNRIVINVGVAYGSDTKLACELIRQAAAKHANILRDPATLVTFEGFGDNSLKLVMRAFLDTLELRLQTIHELHEEIYAAFNEAGIEIAFPQRDLHLRSLPGPLQSWLGNQLPADRPATKND